MGKKIKEIRKSLHINQTDLAIKLNTTQDTISLWELEKSYPSAEIIFEIAQYFNVSTDYLLGLTDDPTPNWVSDTAYVPPQPPQQTHYISTIAKGGKRINKALSEEEYLTIRKELEKDN